MRSTGARQRLHGHGARCASRVEPSMNAAIGFPQMSAVEGAAAGASLASGRVQWCRGSLALSQAGCGLPGLLVLI